jgi:hypothetical protein
MYITNEPAKKGIVPLINSMKDSPIKTLLGNRIPEPFSAALHAKKAIDNMIKISIIQEHNPLMIKKSNRFISFRFI